MKIIFVTRTRYEYPVEADLIGAYLEADPSAKSYLFGSMIEKEQHHA